jgi:hypothetical protein
MLETRPPLGGEVNTQLPAVDKPEQQRLLDLIASRSLGEVAFLLPRPRTSVGSMLHRLGANARMG